MGIVMTGFNILQAQVMDNPSRKAPGRTVGICYIGKEGSVDQEKLVVVESCYF